MSRRFAHHSTRCIDGRLMRHDPQPDDPGLETDIGKCPECEGEGCITTTCDCCGKIREVTKCIAYGIETFACDECRQQEAA